MLVPFKSPCYRSTAGTNGTDFWELHVGKSEIYPEFLEYPGNNPAQPQFLSWKQEDIISGCNFILGNKKKS